MRIYFYTGHLAKGGLETVLDIVANELAARGHEVRVLSAGILPGNPRHLFDTLPNFVDCARNQYGLGANYKGEVAEFQHIMSLQNVLRMLPEPDLIVAAHDPVTNAIAKIASNMMTRRPPVISWVHAPLNRLGNVPMIQYADAHMAISTGIGEQLRSAMPGKPVSVVFNPQLNSEGSIIERAQKPTFLYVGRLDNEQKRIDVILRALGHLANMEWQFNVIGSSVLTTDENTLKQLAADLNISHKVNWLGWSGSPWETVREASALLLSSDYEGFPMVLGEALTRGLPVISSNCATGPADIVMPDKNGYLFNPGDDAGLSAILRSIINKDVILPSVEDCIDSTKRFSKHKVIDQIENTLQHYLIHLSK